jgi:hypothetical protein
MAVSARADDFYFSLCCLRRIHISNKLPDVTEQSEIKIGNDEFDRRWRIMTNRTTTLQAMLTPEFCAKIDEIAAQASGSFYFDNNWFRLVELGDFTSNKRTERYEAMIDFMCDVAESIERTDKEAD